MVTIISMIVSTVTHLGQVDIGETKLHLETARFSATTGTLEL